VNPSGAPGPQRPAGPAPAASQSGASEAPPRVAATPPPSPAPPRSPATVPEAAPLTRFAVEFGPFATAAEAERVERQLNQAGHQTVRFRQQTGATVYGVFVERLPGPREAEALVATLQAEGFGEGTVFVDSQALRVRVGEPVALRGAVQLAERLRARGHAVRITAQPGEAVTFIVRHGNFASREEAEVTGDALTRLGLANHVIRVR
jgi:cell division protein FtsN